MITIFPSSSRDTCKSNVSPLIDFSKGLQDTGSGIGIDLACFHFDVKVRDRTCCYCV